MLLSMPRLRPPVRGLILAVLLLLAWLSLTFIGTKEEAPPKIILKPLKGTHQRPRFDWITERPAAATVSPYNPPGYRVDGSLRGEVGRYTTPILKPVRCRSNFTFICPEKLVNLTSIERQELSEELALRKKSIEEAKVFNAEARRPLAAPKKLAAPQKIMLVSGTDYNDESNKRWNITQQSIANREQYAAHYGFQNKFVNLSSFEQSIEHPVWLKLPLIQETFAAHPEVEWIWWLDSDALIVNQSIDVRSHILEPEILRERLTSNRMIANLNDSYRDGTTYPDKDSLDMSDMLFVFGHDRLSINAGSFFVRRSEITDEILNLWGDRKFIVDENGKRVFFRREQDAFIYLYFHDERVRKHTALVAQPLLNSYPQFFGDEQAYQPGDFVVHHAGQWNHTTLLKHWDKYWETSLKMPVKRVPERPAAVPTKRLPPWKISS